MDLNEDMEFRNIINLLRQLQQVKAPSNFEADLMRRINSEKFSLQNTFWQTIFIPSRMIPAAALAVTVVLLVIVLNNTAVTRENPFSIIPKERQDVILTLKADNTVPVKQIKTDKIEPVEKNKVELKSAPSVETFGLQKDEALRSESAQTTEGYEKTAGAPAEVNLPEKKLTKPFLPPTQLTENESANVTFASGKISVYPVNKAGLNFRQVNPSSQQKIEINQLKEKLEQMYKSKLK